MQHPLCNHFHLETARNLQEPLFSQSGNINFSLATSGCITSNIVDSNNARMMSYENPVWALLLCLTYFSKSAFCAREQRAYNIISFRLMMSVGEKKEQQMKEKVLDDGS